VVDSLWGDPVWGDSVWTSAENQFPQAFQIELLMKPRINLHSDPIVSEELLQGYRQISQQTLTIVDVETTGSVASRCRVIEISVLKASLQDGIQEHLTHLVNPLVLVPAAITRFTGISQQWVDQAPPAAEIFPQYLPLLNGDILTAHNLVFDYAFLQAEYQRLGIPFSRPISHQLCTVKLARLLLADLPSRSLPYLVEYFGFDVGRSHRAEADTLACWLLAQRLLHEIQNESDETLLARFAKQWLTLDQASALLGGSPAQTRSRLEQAKVTTKISKRSGLIWYRRGDVQQLMQAQESD
jgi:DNA polymerase III subunit epsilon